MARRFNPYLIDRSADYLSNSIERAVTAFDTQMANIEKSKNELALQDAELKRISSSLSAGDEQNFKDDLTKAINDEIDRIYRLGYNSIGRDQTEYMKAQSNLINGIKDLQSGLAIFDEEGKEYQKIVNSGQALTKISNTTDPKARDFMNNLYLNNGNGTKISYENGNFSLNYNGYSKNISNYMQARKNGSPAIINYVDDPSSEYKAIYDKYSSKYKPLITQIQKESADGSITTTTERNYDLARKEIRKDLINDPNLLTSISGDEWQFLSQYSGNYKNENGEEIIIQGPFSNDEKIRSKQIKDALEVKVNLIMDQYANESQVTEIIKKSSDKKLEQARRTKDYSAVFEDEYNTSLNILNSDNPLESYAQYLRDLNPSNPPNLIIKNDKLYRVDFQGQGKDASRVEKQIISSSALEPTDANLKKLIIQINESKGKDVMIPTSEMTALLRTLQTAEEEVEEPVEETKDTGKATVKTSDNVIKFTDILDTNIKRDLMQQAIEKTGKDVNRPDIEFGLGKDKFNNKDEDWPIYIENYRNIVKDYIEENAPEITSSEDLSSKIKNKEIKIGSLIRRAKDGRLYLVSSSKDGFRLKLYEGK